MKIQIESHAAFSIADNGAITLKSSWLASDGGGVAALLADARAWAGSPGDPFREPLEAGGFSLSETVRITTVELTPTDEGNCRITFTGEPLSDSAAAQAGPVVESRTPEGARSRTATWHAGVNFPPESIPAVGAALDWSGGIFVCSACEQRTFASRLEFTVSAVEVNSARLGESAHDREADGAESKRVSFLVGRAALTEFLAANANGSAAAWAGSGYFLDSVKVAPYQNVGFLVHCTARKVVTRLLGTSRSESFAGFYTAGEPRREIVWQGRYCVHADDLATFRNLTGSSAASWSENDCIVTKVTPTRRSAVEYEVVVEAQHRRNPGLFQRYSEDDRSDLDNRTDVNVDMTEFHITPEMAGYRITPGGVFQPIPAWSAAAGCPFSTGGELLDPAMIEANLRTLTITETAFLSGKPKSRLSSLATWAQSRVFQGSVAGHTGSYLRIRQTCAETRDASGSVYPRVSRTYQLAPGSFQWNSTYWNNH